MLAGACRHQVSCLRLVHRRAHSGDSSRAQSCRDAPASLLPGGSPTARLLFRRFGSVQSTNTRGKTGDKPSRDVLPGPHSNPHAIRTRLCAGKPGGGSTMAAFTVWGQIQGIIRAARSTAPHHSQVLTGISEARTTMTSGKKS